jgi:voltage-gated potassium channel Kch
MSSLPPDGDGESLSGHAIIAGFGVPGRAVGELLAARHVPFVVVELNPKTVDRCSHSGVHIIEGDVRQEQTLRRAGIERATLFAITVPDDQTAMEAVRIARSLNSTVPIVARCHFISNGMEAHRRGASEVVIEEKVVAQEFVRLLNSSTKLLPTESLAADPT